MSKKMWIIIGSVVAVLALFAGIGSMANGGKPPTAQPTVEATTTPTVEPTIEPTVEPTSEPVAEPTNDPDTTESGLGFGWATTGCDTALETDLVYGFNAKWLWDGIHRVEGDSMFLKAGGWAKNAYGTKQDVTFECRVSGTDGAPVVDSIVYY